jgi:hypothetical protein
MTLLEPTLLAWPDSSPSPPHPGDRIRQIEICGFTGRVACSPIPGCLERHRGFAMKMRRCVATAVRSSAAALAWLFHKVFPPRLSRPGTAFLLSLDASYWTGATVDAAGGWRRCAVQHHGLYGGDPCAHTRGRAQCRGHRADALYPTAFRLVSDAIAHVGKPTLRSGWVRRRRVNRHRPSPPDIGLLTVANHFFCTTAAGSLEMSTALANARLVVFGRV